MQRIDSSICNSCKIWFAYWETFMNTERYKSHGNQFMKRRTIRKLYMNNDTPWWQIYGAWKLLLSTSSSPYPFFTILFVLFLFLFLLLSLISLLILLILHFLLSHFPFLLHLLFFYYFLRLFLGLRTKSFTAIKKTQRSSSDFDRWRWFRVDWMLQLNSDYSISPRVRKSPRIDENYNANKRIDGKVRETARWLFAVRPRSNGCVDTLFKLMVSNWTVSGAALLY